MKNRVALPTGIVPEQSYAEVFGHLPEGMRFVLLSDRVVEARGTDGEVYGLSGPRS